MIYVVSYSDWESYAPVIVEGPEVPNWEQFCDSLVPEAIDFFFSEKYPWNKSWLGNDEIKECIVEILKTKGYAVLRPPEAKYTGGCIIEGEGDYQRIDHSVMKRVIDYNRDFRQKLYEGGPE